MRYVSVLFRRNHSTPPSHIKWLRACTYVISVAVLISLLGLAGVILLIQKLLGAAATGNIVALVAYGVLSCVFALLSLIPPVIAITFVRTGFYMNRGNAEKALKSADMLMAFYGRSACLHEDTSGTRRIVPSRW